MKEYLKTADIKRKEYLYRNFMSVWILFYFIVGLRSQENKNIFFLPCNLFNTILWNENGPIFWVQEENAHRLGKVLLQPVSSFLNIELDEFVKSLRLLPEKSDSYMKTLEVRNSMRESGQTPPPITLDNSFWKKLMDSIASENIRQCNSNWRR